MKLWKQFEDLKQMIKDDDYLHIVNELTIECKGLYKNFRDAPAAKYHHHAYIHGLLEHTVGVTNKALSMADEATDKDLLITGALLHDIGKTREYDWSGCTITRTNRGKLLGHIVMGCLMIEEVDSRTETTPLEKSIKLLHLIASHHGKKEWGSPVEPMTKEAIILHQADMLDYQMHVIDKARNEAAEDAEWTGKVNGIGREFYLG